MMKINNARNLALLTAAFLLLVQCTLQVSSSSTMAPTSDGTQDRSPVVYRVGWAAWTGAVHSKHHLRGWTPINYQAWADSKAPFHVGDVLHFVFPVGESVIRVSTLQDYTSCNIASPLAVYTSGNKGGNEYITLTDEGVEYYFISGYLDYCRTAGQRFHLQVVPRTKIDTSSASATAPMPAPLSVNPIKPAPASPADSPTTSFGHAEASNSTSNKYRNVVRILTWTSVLVFFIFAVAL